MTYGELIRAAKNNEPLDQEPNWLQELVMAYARGWRASPVHYCVAIAIGLVVVGSALVQLSVPGRIRIDSTPTGATVIVDGKAVGQTPIVLSHPEKREHKLELNKSGFEPLLSYFTVSAGAPSSYEFELHGQAPVEPPAPIASAPTVRGPSVAMADTTPTSTLADQFRSSRGSSKPRAHSRRAHR